jgi:hypothetical protein
MGNEAPSQESPKQEPPKKEPPKKPGFWKSLVKALRTDETLEARAEAGKEVAEEASKKIGAVPAVGKAVMPREAIEKDRARKAAIDKNLEENR